MNNTILITGGSRGIGRELALQAEARGDTVIVTVRNTDADHRLPASIRVEQLDVKRPEESAALAASLDGIAIDTLVCNAGIFPSRGGIREADYSVEDWVQGMMTNVAGPFYVVRALLPNLTASRSPKVAMISSSMGSSTNAAGGSYIYRASKAAVTNLACNLAVELAPQRIAVGAFDPGWVKTDMGTDAAPLNVSNSVAGLLERIDGLHPDNTGIFETWMGDRMPF
ncbi:SDR family oxidoreductase [Amaricoccus tamworthensis]|uniref:SDR family oxidoreductase n=1 Tax=Amaricoccus tamworthensis TaxID=57002 RepID=UPI003C7980B4